MRPQWVEWPVIGFLAGSLAGFLCPANAQSTLNLTRQAPSPVASATASPVGGPNGGSAQTLYYWVVARYPAGRAVPTGPVVTTNAAAVLNGSHFVTVSWTGVGGATGYDVVRNSSNVYPEPCAACAVTLNTAGTAVNDTGAALSAYPPAGVGTAQSAVFNMTVNNQDAANPFIAAQLTGSGADRMALLSGLYAVGDCTKMSADGTLSSAGICGGIAGTVTPTQGGTGLTSYTKGDMLYASATDVLSRLPGSTTAVTKFLSQTGNGVTSGAPTWSPLPVSGLLTFFFVDAASDLASDKQAPVSSLYTPAALASVSVSVTGAQLVQTWATDAGYPGLTFIPDGIIHLHIHASRTGMGSGQVTITPALYYCAADGTGETLIATLESSDNLTTTDTGHDLAGIIPAPVPIAVTSRLLVKFTATATATRTVVLSYDGVGAAETFSRIEVPSPAIDTNTYVPFVGATRGVTFGAHAQTMTDIATPAPPAAGDTKYYTKGGKLCSLDSGSAESCTGAIPVPLALTYTSSTANTSSIVLDVSYTDSGNVTAGSKSKYGQQVTTAVTGDFTPATGESLDVAGSGLSVSYTGTVNGGGSGDTVKVHGSQVAVTASPNLADAMDSVSVVGGEFTATETATGPGTATVAGVVAVATGTGTTYGVTTTANGTGTNYGVYTNVSGGLTNYAVFTAGVSPSMFGGPVTITGALTMSSAPKFVFGNTTGAGTATLGAANSPAVDPTAVYTWLTVTCGDASVCYIPVWK